MSLIVRYARLYGYFLRFSLTKALHFRMDFFFRILMDCLFYASSFGLFGILTLETGALGEWSREQVFLFVGTFIVIDALEMTFFSNNMYFLPTAINKGDLDYYLVRPINSLFFLIFKDFAFNSLVNLILALSICTYTIASSDIVPADILTFLGYGIGVTLGVCLSTCVGLLISVIPVFWTQGGTNLQQLYFQLGILSEHPIIIYRGWAKKLLTYIVPLGIVASLPAQILWEGVLWSNLGFLALLTGVFVLGTVLLWNLGLRNYSSASS